MKIVYIQDPKFEVDFKSYESKYQFDKKTSSLQGIAEIGRISISFFT